MKKYVLLLIALLLTGCNDEGKRIAEAEAIRQEIIASTSCQTKADCVSLGSPCPFGCEIVVNDKKAPYLMALIKAYDEKYPERCVYKCARYAGYDCVAGQCQALPLCTENAQCDYMLNCARLNNGIKSGYRPMCVVDKTVPSGKSCRCMCPGCE